MHINNRIRLLLTRLSPVATGLVLTVFTASCDKTRNDKGHEYFPDMAHSLAYETYSPNPNFTDGKTQQAPVSGTINRESAPYPYPVTEEGRALAGKELKNPLTANPEVITSGQEKYTVFCENCHGNKGDGNGYLFTSRRFPVKPASYLSERIMSLPEGELNHVITCGYNTMGPHASQIRPDDRWKIILYIQHVLQHKQ